MEKTVFITGASRGVGLEVAKKFASVGCNVAFIAKTMEEHPKLPGTIATAEAEIIAAGAKNVCAIQCDIRNLDALKDAVDLVGRKFGKIDVLVNNASALYLVKSKDITPSKFNLLHEIIVRGSFYAAQFALPWLRKATNAHIVNLAPTINLAPKWFYGELEGHTAYTMCKYSSALMVIGLAAELHQEQIAVNAVWPKTLLATAAVQNLLGGDMAINGSRHPRIIADAIFNLTQQTIFNSGKFYLDEELVPASDLSQYSMIPNAELIPDLYVD